MIRRECSKKEEKRKVKSSNTHNHRILRRDKGLYILPGRNPEEMRA